MTNPTTWRLVSPPLLGQSVRLAADFDLMPQRAARAASQRQFDQRHIALPRRDDRRQVQFAPAVAICCQRPPDRFAVNRPAWTIDNYINNINERSLEIGRNKTS
jgi:hypothetical protein